MKIFKQLASVCNLHYIFICNKSTQCSRIFYYFLKVLLRQWNLNIVKYWAKLGWFIADIKTSVFRSLSMVYTLWIILRGMYFQVYLISYPIVLILNFDFYWNKFNMSVFMELIMIVGHDIVTYKLTPIVLEHF